MTTEKAVHYEGSCSFLLCLKTEAHDHPVCPDCGGVNWANMNCPTCRQHRPGYEMELRAGMKQAGIRRIDGSEL